MNPVTLLSVCGCRREAGCFEQHVQRPESGRGQSIQEGCTVGGLGSQPETRLKSRRGQLLAVAPLRKNSERASPEWGVVNWSALVGH